MRTLDVCGMRMLVPPVLLAVAALTGCFTASLHNRDWYQVRTPHYEIVSSVSPEATADLARNAELFHAAAEFLIGGELPAPSIPTRVLAFDGRGFRRPFAVRGADSFFGATARDVLLVFRTGAGWAGGARRLTATPDDLPDEYMHYLLASYGAFGDHLWFKEGLSQLMSTVELQVDRVDLGHFREDYVNKLRTDRWIPLIRVLRTTSLEGWGERRRPLFEAEAWAFVHYLYLGGKGPKEGLARAQRYFEEVEKGSSYEQSIRRAFGKSSSALQKDLRDYIFGQGFEALEVHFPHIDAIPIHVEPMAKDDVFIRLGWVLVQLGREDHAQAWFERALADDPSAARAHAGLGRTMAMRGEWEESLVHAKRAVEIAPNQALNRIDLAIAYYLHASASKDPQTRAGLAEKSREQLRKSAELDDSLPQPYVVYGQTYLLPGENASEGLRSLERASRMLPGDDAVKLDLARAYLAVGRLPPARKVTLEALSNTHVEALRDRARKLLEEIDASAASAQATGGPSQ